MKEVDKYPEGHFVWIWMGIGVVAFSVVGVSLSILLKNFGVIGVWPAFGVMIGFVIGKAIENKHEEEGMMRPLTNKEKKVRILAVAVLLILLLLVAVVFSMMYFLK